MPLKWNIYIFKLCLLSSNEGNVLITGPYEVKYYRQLLRQAWLKEKKLELDRISIIRAFLPNDQEDRLTSTRPSMCLFIQSSSCACSMPIPSLEPVFPVSTKKETAIKSGSRVASLLCWAKNNKVVTSHPTTRVMYKSKKQWNAKHGCEEVAVIH